MARTVETSEPWETDDTERVGTADQQPLNCYTHQRSLGLEYTLPASGTKVNYVGQKQGDYLFCGRVLIFGSERISGCPVSNGVIPKA